MRFPGQYTDAETNLAYNYFRHYDPGMGRYVEADLIGFAGGINLFAYVDSMPVDYADPSGLQPRVVLRRPGIHKALQDLLESLCDWSPAICLTRSIICLEAECTRILPCGAKYTYRVEYWIPSNPPARDPGPGCICTRRKVVGD